MGVYRRLINFDEVFHNYVGKAPTIINDIEAFTEEDKDKLDKLIFTKYSGDLLSNIPSCECGEVTGEYNVGVLCRSCGTNVESHLDKDLTPMTWIRAPYGVAKLMNPLVWTMLKKQFTISSYNIIQWLCDSTYAPGTRPPPVLTVVAEMKIDGKPIERGYNFFVENFDKIIENLFSIKTLKKTKARHSDLEILLKKERDKIFSTYLALPHRSLLVVEENDVSVFIDPITTKAIDAIRTLAGIDTGAQFYTPRVKQNRTVKTIDQLADNYTEINKKTVAKKPGLYRKHVYATRVHFSFRAVITSITEPHNYDEIYVPWGVATSVLRLHITNKLLKMDYTPNEAATFIDAHADRYHPLLDQIFNELITEAGNGRGIPCLVNRNPSLKRGSIQLCYISKIIKDPSITTVSISILIVRELNADESSLSSLTS